MRAPFLLLAFPLAACVSTPSGEAVFRRTASVDYAKLGACAFMTLDRLYPTTIRFADLRGENLIRIYQEDTAVGLVGSATARVWDMTIRKAGAGSAVEIAGKPTVRGATFYGERTWGEISECVR